jgi:hypothetical protein
VKFTKGDTLPVEKFTISRDDTIYECFPHLCKTEPGRFLVANYINNDAPLAQIRGYRFGLEDF